MSPDDVLRDVLEAVTQSADVVYFGGDQVSEWPCGVLASFLVCGLLKPAPPARTLECRGCAEGCLKPLVTLAAQAGRPGRTVILCDEDPALGRIPVAERRLLQWQSSQVMLAKWLYATLDGIRPPESGILAALPTLAWERLLRMEGLQLVVDTAALTRALQPVPDPSRPPAAENRIYRSGDYWSVTFDGKTVNLKNSVGMRSIDYLMRKQGVEVHSMEIAQAINPPPPDSDASQRWNQMSTEQLAELGLSVSGGGAGFNMLDDKAYTDLQDALGQLHEQIQDAELIGDTEKQAELEALQQQILGHLVVSRGLGGKPRKSADLAERMRKLVERRIHMEIARIAETFPSFAHHLRGITTGTYCVYRPRPPVTWKFSPPA